MKKIVILCLLCASCMQSPVQEPVLNPKEERVFLLKNVKEMKSVGDLGEIILFKENSFPILLSSKDEKTIVAAATMGKGKIVAFAHDGFFGEEGVKNTQTGQLISNAIRWSANKKNEPVVLVRDLDLLATYLKKQGFTIKKVKNKEILSEEILKTVDVIILDPNLLKEEKNEIEILKKAIKNGKGGLFAALGWSWQQQNPTLSLKNDFKSNILLAEAGIEWTSGNATGKQIYANIALAGTFSYEEAKKYVLENDFRKADKKSFSNALKKVMQMIPFVAQTQKGFTIPADFPGNAPTNTPTVTKSVTINAKTPYWHCTGLYAQAGANIKITTQESIKNGKYMVRIGAHTDNLYDVAEPWTRMPEISLSFSLQNGTTQIFNPFGGMIYIEVPENNQANSTLMLTISGAVEAPFFKLGQTSLEDWKSKIRNSPAPWAEIEGNEFAFTVQSEYVRKLDNPQKIAEYWDKIQATNRELVDWDVKKPHKMRLAFDKQISGGYMHSGYPIMALTGKDYVDEQANIIDIKNKKKWGFVHELGHNHQEEAWTFDGTEEVTCNLFSMHASENLTPKAIKKRWNDYVNTGKSYKKWEKEAFLAFIMYKQLVDYYGWENLKKVFKAYHLLSEKQLPKDDDSKIDTWLKMYSTTVGEDLSDFFDAWNMPVSAKAKKSLSNLPKANTKKILVF
jgi:hypothetical protein